MLLSTMPYELSRQPQVCVNYFAISSVTCTEQLCFLFANSKAWQHLTAQINVQDFSLVICLS